MVAYPLKFTPILQEKIWGGTKLKTLLNKSSRKDNIGESWEISAVEGNVSVVANGIYKDLGLNDLLKRFKSDLLGEKVYKTFVEKFPLLIKFIDAKTALSIQLHPNDTLAQKRHKSFGKTEMWYVMQADAQAKLIVGFKKDTDKKTYLEYLNKNKIADLLNSDVVKEGDVYFIPTGRIHAIGAGVLLAEIQQTSDITYRIYDWDRKDTFGKGRELHTALALDAIDYKAKKHYKTSYISELNKVSPVISCPYFTTNIISLNGSVSIDNSSKDSFVIYMCTKGEAMVCYNNEQLKLQTGETILVPSCLTKLSLESEKETVLLEVYI